MTFETGWNLPIGTTVKVSDDTFEPNDLTSLAWSAWRSHNFVGELVEKVDGPPRCLRITLQVSEHALVTYDVSEAVPHTVREFFDELTETKLAKWIEIRDAKNASRYGGCMTPLGRMQSDEVSKNLLTSAVGLAGLLGEAFTINWTMEDNSVVTHDAGAINGAGIAMGIWYASRQDLAEAFRVQINNAINLDEVEAIAWPS